MKKIIIFFTLLVLMISSSFAFDVLNSDDNSQTYFNTNNDDVKVKTDVNASILTVKYGTSSTRVQNYTFGTCSSSKCVTFDLTDLLDSNSDSYSNSLIEFVLDVNGDQKSIYLDTEKPVLNITNVNVDTSAKTIKFDYKSSDNDEVSNVKLYTVLSSTETFVNNLTSNSYTFTGVSKSSYTFLFKVYDRAGNVNEITKTVSVGDLTQPVINKAVLIKNDDDSFELEMKFTDNEGLDRYEISQGSIVLKGDISGTSYSKTIKTPFTSGDVTLKVYDNKNNVVSKKLDLDTKISNSYSSKYSDSKYFKLTSNADSCELTEVDGDSESKGFDKDDDEFEVKVGDAPENEEISIEFYCDKDGFREYFERDFFYDNEDPENSNLAIEKTEDGYLKLNWDEAEDKQSDVDYILYRDDDKIYSGSKLEYVDKKVIYPEEYEYYLKVQDEAGNNVETNTVKAVPKKVSVSFNLDDSFENKVNESDFNLVFDTEKNVNVTLKIVNGNQEIANNDFRTTSEKVSLNFKLLKGQNLIYLTLKDDLGNVNTVQYSVIYEPEVLVSSNSNGDSQDLVSTPQELNSTNEDVITNPTNQTSNEEIVDDGIGYSSIFWFVIIVVAFVYFLWFFVINEDALRIRDRYRARKNRSALDKKKTFNSGVLPVKRNKDSVLAKDFERIKRERIQKQEAKKFEDMKRKKLEEKQVARTELEKKKLADLAEANKREVVIPFSERVKAKRRVDKIKKDESYEDELISSRDKAQINKERKSMFGKKEIKEPSEMDLYLQKTTSHRGWDSSRDYVFKPEPVKVEEPKENLTNLQSSKEEVQVPKQESWFGGIFTKNKTKESGDEIPIDEVDKIVHNSVPVSEEKPKQEIRKVDLDDYLSGIAKKKKRKSFYFAERSVDKDLESRK